jgi:hypothetical protein
MVVRDRSTVVLLRTMHQGPVEVVAWVLWFHLYRPIEVTQSFIQIPECEVSAAPVQESAMIAGIVL